MFIVFLTTLAAGLLGVLAMCRMTQVAWRYVRLMAIFSLCLLIPVLAGFALWRGWQRGSWPVWAAALTASGAMAAFVVLGLAPTARRYGSTIRFFSGLGALLAMGAAWTWGFDYGIWPQGSRLMIRASLAGQALSALLVGSVSLATALGHAYLTHTAMTIHPLRRLSRIFAVAVWLRITWIVLVLVSGFWYAPAEGTPLTAMLRSHWLLLAVRCGIGLLIPALFAYMVLQTVRLRATQSATGILYFTLVLVFVGELAALHLTRENGIPF